MIDGKDASRLGRLLPAIESWRRMVSIAGLALLATGAYIAAVMLKGEAGFPLDDSWIHQTYARNLAQLGRWEFVAGEVSSGSTAPLWTLLLSLGHLLGLPFLLWAYLLGWVSLFWVAWSTLRLSQTLWPERDGNWWPAVVAVFSWPLIWAAGSGMETLLFTGLALQILVCHTGSLAREKWPAVPLGLLGGLLVLTRPEGVLLLGLVGLSITFSAPRTKVLVSRLIPFAAALMLPLAAYAALNWTGSGNLLPNTFYAKQAEYAYLWQQPIHQRIGQLLIFSLGGPPSGLQGISGAHLVLLPGVVAAAVRTLRHDWVERCLVYSLPLWWALGLIFLYAWRLPVTYHHGRYLWPVLPVWIVYGLVGWHRLIGSKPTGLIADGTVGFILRRVAVLTLVSLLAVFFVLGMQAYETDVAFVNGEMVTVAKWLEENVAADALVAAHDIGALGYFAPQPILDLAGLISPEVVPLLGDEPALAAYVRQSSAEYLVTAPGWTYEPLTLSADVTAVFSTDYAWTRRQGYNNMTVYRLAR